MSLAASIPSAMFVPSNSQVSRTYRLVQHFDRRVMGELWKRRSSLDSEQQAVLKALYDKRENGTMECRTPIIYRLSVKTPGKLGYGRYYGSKGSLETVQADFRGALCHRLYSDVDIVNCHPVLLVQMAKKCFNMDMPNLSHYVQNRDEVLATLSGDPWRMSHEEGKDAVIKVLYNGGLMPSAPALIAGIKAEVVAVAKRFAADAPSHKDLYEYCKRQKDNTLGSFMSYLLQTEERKCLDAMVAYLTEKGLSVDVLCYDGCMVRGTDTATADILAGCEAAVLEKTGYRISLKVKPMVGMPELEPAEPETADGTSTTSADSEGTGEMDDSTAAKRFVELMGNSIARDGQTVYGFDWSTGLWDCTDIALRAAVVRHSASLVFKVTTEDEEGNTKTKTVNYGGLERHVTAMLKWVGVYVPDTNFLSQRLDTGFGKLLFADGIYDMATGEFTEGFNPDVLFLQRIKRPFQRKEDRNADLEKKVHQSLFVDPFSGRYAEAGEYLLDATARAIAGEYRRKRFYVGVGESDAGKGVYTAAMRGAFGGYVGEWNANNLLYNPTSGDDEAKKLKWLVSLEGRRLAISNEMRIDKRGADGNLMKSAASGGDELTVRLLNQNERQMVNRCSLMLMCNDMPPFCPMDAGVRNRLRAIGYAQVFKVGADAAKGEKEADPSIKDKFKNDEAWQNALFWVVADKWRTCHGKEPVEPACVMDETREWTDDGAGDVKALLEEEYVITHSADDAVPARDIIAYFSRAGDLRMLPQKLGRELTKLIRLPSGVEPVVNIRNVKHRVGLKRKEAAEAAEAAPSSAE